MRTLIVTAVEAEAGAVRKGLTGCDVQAVGVGPAVAAAATARLLTLAEAGGNAYSRVVSMGIAGGFPGAVPVGGLVVATRSVFADLGAQSADGFLTIDELGFGSGVSLVDGDLDLPGAVRGAILTVATVTGTAERAAELRRLWPDAVAEGMEGAGVAAAAAACGLPFAEIRTISNPVGPRDRAAWRIGEALAALTDAAAAFGDNVAGERLREPPGVQSAGERLREPPGVQSAGERLREPPGVQSAGERSREQSGAS